MKVLMNQRINQQAGIPTKATINHSAGISISRQCDLLSFPRSTYYAPESSKELVFSDEEERAMAAIDRIHLKRPCFGARRISKELKRKDKIKMGRRKVARLMESKNVFFVGLCYQHMSALLGFVQRITYHMASYFFSNLLAMVIALSK